MNGLLLDRKTGLYYREGTLDKFIIGERGTYRPLEPFSSRDVILDIGACFGSFAKSARETGARVIAFEPHPENFELLSKNSSSPDNIHGAITGGNQTHIDLYIADSINNGIHSTIPRRGRSSIRVPAFNFKSMLNKYRPNKLKIDAEGVEFELFENDLPRYVKAFVIEIHLNRKAWREEAKNLASRFIQSGFIAVREPVIGEKNWTTIGAYRR